MKIYISSAGVAPRLIAPALRDLLATMLQSAQIYEGGTTILPGYRWFNELVDFLRNADYGLILATAENLHSRWLYFDVGALTAGHARIIPIAVGISPAALPEPLSQFQAATLDRSGMIQLV